MNGAGTAAPVLQCPAAPMRPATRAIAYGVMMLACLAAAFSAGKDLNWDLLNYHLYAGHSALHGGVASGYFAASLQGYLNPYAHVPLYWMVSHGVDPRLIVLALAAFHALNLLFIFEIAALLCRRGDGRLAWWAVGLAVLFAALNPIFLQELGTSFIEVSTSVFVLAGWYGLVRTHHRPSLPLVALSGLVIGVGIALKMTNVYFSVTALPLLLLLPTGLRQRGHAVLAYALGGIAGVLLAGGWWSWQLWEMFRNPVFPMFNNLFTSPDFVPEAMKHYRFIPVTWQEALLKPFSIMLPDAYVYIETAAPDARYAAILLFPLLFLGKYVLARRGGATPALLAPAQHTRAALALGLSMVLAWVVWLATSGNGRYFLPMSLLSAVVLAALFVRLTSHRKVIVYGVLALLAVQSLQMTLGATTRWGATPWGRQWIELDVPQDLQARPTLHLSIGEDSASFILPYLAPGSEFIAVTGQFGVANNARVQALRARHAGRVRALRYDYLGPLGVVPFMNFYLVHFGLQVDQSDCQAIRLHRGVELVKGKRPSADRDYLSCATKPLGWSSAQWDSYARAKQQADRAFDLIEDLCPALFSPRRVLSEGDGKSFVRHYLNTDSQMNTRTNGMVVYRNVFRFQQPQQVGLVEDLLASPPRAEQVCPGGRTL